MTSTIRLHKGDISAADAARYTDAIAIDTETLGLVPRRDRLCVVQLSPGDGSADVIQIARGQTEAPNLVAMLGDPTREKIFHFGRFDIAVLFHTFGVTTTPVFCTKIASRLTRTYTDRHGLKDNLKELLDIDVSKVQQQSDWAAETVWYRIALGGFGLVVLTAVRWVSRRSSRVITVPALLSDAVAATLFGLGGVVTLGLGIDAVVHGTGPGQWLSAAPVALAASLWFTMRTVRALSRPYATIEA